MLNVGLALGSINPVVVPKQHPCHKIIWPGTVEYLITSGQTQRVNACPSSFSLICGLEQTSGAGLCPQNLFALEEVISKALIILLPFALRCGRTDTEPSPFTPPAIKEEAKVESTGFNNPSEQHIRFQSHTLACISSDQNLEVVTVRLEVFIVF